MQRNFNRDTCDQLFDTVRAAFLVVAILLLFLLTACASVAPEVVKREAARALTKYCMTFSYEVRSGVLRPEFNTLIAPHQAKVDCYGDPDNPKKESNKTADNGK